MIRVMALHGGVFDVSADGKIFDVDEKSAKEWRQQIDAAEGIKCNLLLNLVARIAHQSGEKQ